MSPFVRSLGFSLASAPPIASTSRSIRVGHVCGYVRPLEIADHRLLLASVKLRYPIVALTGQYIFDGGRHEISIDPQPDQKFPHRSRLVGQCHEQMLGAHSVRSESGGMTAYRFDHPLVPGTFQSDSQQCWIGRVRW